jgi:hypothetical protein
MYLISKLFLNSLYGRFGMSPYLVDHIVLDCSKFEKFAEKYIIIDCIDFLNGKLLVTYDPILLTDDPQNTNVPKVSVAIASAITAYSRILMTPYILNYQNSILAIDTDGVKYEGTINSELIGQELGQMKHEGTYSDSVFVAPKIYGLFNKYSNPVIKAKGLKNYVSF